MTRHTTSRMISHCVAFYRQRRTSMARLFQPENCQGKHSDGVAGSCDGPTSGWVERAGMLKHGVYSGMACRGAPHWLDQLLRRMECAFTIGSRVQRASGPTRSWKSLIGPPARSSRPMQPSLTNAERPGCDRSPIGSARTSAGEDKVRVRSCGAPSQGCGQVRATLSVASRTAAGLRKAPLQSTGATSDAR